jgi:hypothetical protein
MLTIVKMKLKMGYVNDWLKSIRSRKIDILKKHKPRMNHKNFLTYVRTIDRELCFLHLESRIVNPAS